MSKHFYHNLGFVDIIVGIKLNCAVVVLSYCLLYYSLAPRNKELSILWSQHCGMGVNSTQCTYSIHTCVHYTHVCINGFIRKTNETKLFPELHTMYIGINKHNDLSFS